MLAFLPPRQSLLGRQLSTALNMPALTEYDTLQPDTYDALRSKVQNLKHEQQHFAQSQRAAKEVSPPWLCCVCLAGQRSVAMVSHMYMPVLAIAG